MNRDTSRQRRPRTGRPATDPGALVPSVGSPDYGREHAELQVPLFTAREDRTERVREFAEFWRWLKTHRGRALAEQFDGCEWVLPLGTRLPGAMDGD